MKRRRVTVSPSNAPGMSRSTVYLDLALYVSIWHVRLVDWCGNAELNAVGKPIVNDRDDRHSAGRHAQRHTAAARGRPVRASALACSCALLAPQPTATAPASQTASASSGSPAAWAWATSEITSASSATASRSPSAASRASPSAYSWSPSSSARSGLGRTSDGAVVQPRALEDHLEQQLVLARARRGRGPAAARCGTRLRRPAVDRPARSASSASSPPWLAQGARERLAHRQLRRTPRRRPRSSAPRPGRCAPATGTTPRTATAGGYTPRASKARHHAP